MSKRPIYVAIMAAFEAGCGIHVTAAEVKELAADDAIAHRAAVFLVDDDEFITDEHFSWTKALRALQEQARAAIAKAKGSPNG